MPAWRLNRENRRVCHFDVGAMDGRQPNSIMHVALCIAEAPATVSADSRSISVVHMGPPLGQRSIKIDVLGSTVVEPQDLHPSERRKIKAFVDERLRERDAQQMRLNRLKTIDRYCDEYLIHPAFLEPTAAISIWRFNCSGFVLRAYLEAGIDLVDCSKLPMISLAEIKKAYPHFAHSLDSNTVRIKLGIGQGDEWPVALAGYVINSLARSPKDIRAAPYVPVRDDSNFPRSLG